MKGKMDRMKVTMKDVAKYAGVSLGSVSKVINKIHVKEVTREKVLNAIEELNYEIDENARALKTNRSHTVALILPSIWHPFFSEFAYHIEEHLSKNKYKLFLCNSDGDAEKENEYIQMVRQSKVDGIIGITYSDIDRYVSSQLPFVTIDRHFSEEVTYVTSDNFHGGEIAAEELVKRQCKKLAFVGAISVYPTETQNRKHGFIHYCGTNQIDFVKFTPLEPINYLSGELEDFLRENAEVDGIFAINDLVALQTIQIMTKLNKKVIEDYQIIGFDGIRKNNEFPYELSTIAQPIEKMAEAAVQTLLALITGNSFEQRTILPVTFQPGETTINNK